jgi:hypothetical protein
MREALLGKLLLLLVHATLEELRAVYRLLSDQPAPETAMGAELPEQGSRGEGAEVSSSSCRFGLNKGQGAWALTYEGAQAAFADRAHMDCAVYLLKHPRQPMHPVTLLARVHGQAPLEQRSSALDDADATRKHLREMERLRAVISDEGASEGERRVAEEALAGLEGSVAEIYHQTIDDAAKTAKGVRQAIRRACESLAEAKDEHGRPHPVLTAFAAHLRTHLLAPSATGSRGHLVYEPPPGVVWS